MRHFSPILATLVKVVRDGGEVARDAQRLKRGDVDRGLPTLGDLQATLNEKKGFTHDYEFVCVEGLAWDEEIGDAVFVLQRDEAVTFGGARALAADHQAGDDEWLAMGHFKKAGRSGEVDLLLLSPKAHRVWPGGRAEEGEIGIEALGGRHHAENVFLGRWG